MKHIITEAQKSFWLPKDTLPKGRHAPVEEDCRSMLPIDDDHPFTGLDRFDCHLVWDTLTDIEPLLP